MFLQIPKINKYLIKIVFKYNNEFNVVKGTFLTGDNVNVTIFFIFKILYIHGVYTVKG